MELINKELFGTTFHFSERGIEYLFSSIAYIVEFKDFLQLVYNDSEKKYFIEGISLKVLTKEINSQTDIAFELLLITKQKNKTNGKYWDYIDYIDTYSFKK